MKLIPKMIIILLLLSIACVALGSYFIFFTSEGCKILLSRVLSDHLEKEEVAYRDIQGNLAQGIIFDNLELTDLKGFPTGTRLRVQKLFMDLSALSIEGLVLKMDNGRLLLPGSEPIVIFGSMKDETVDINVFSSGFSVQSLLYYFPQLQKPSMRMTGTVGNVDLYLKGEYTSPTVTGQYFIEVLNFRGLRLTETTGEVMLDIKDINDDFKLFGDILINQGKLLSKNVVINLKPGKIKFTGDPKTPSYDLKGESVIDKTKIFVALSGTLEEPKLILTSDPPYSREKLMIMLATGKKWRGLDDSLEKGGLSADLTKDFVDFFIFGGLGNSFAKKFGLSDVSVTYEKDRKGIGAKTDLTDKLEVGYGVEQKATEAQTPTISQKVQGQYKLTDQVSFEVEADIRQKAKDNIQEVQQENINNSNVDNKVLLKYKKSF